MEETTVKAQTKAQMEALLVEQAKEELERRRTEPWRQAFITMRPLS
jgi:hypothetical protein